MNIRQIRTFVPSKEFKISKAFYLELGFEIIWEGEDLIEFGTLTQNFFLQDYYVKKWAENCMLQLFTDDLEALYHVAQSLTSKYKNTKIKPIFQAEYGKTFHLIDPAGVLWHMTEVAKEVTDKSKLLCEEN